MLTCLRDYLRRERIRCCGCGRRPSQDLLLECEIAVGVTELLELNNLHVIGDLLGSVAAVIAALVILATGWMPIDPLLSIVVALIILRSAWRVVADSGHILLEGSPPDVDSRALRDQLRSALPFVLDVHHVHAWSISQERPMVTLHASVAANTDSAVAVREIKRELAQHFRITHATVEIEYDACGDDPQRRTC